MLHLLQHLCTSPSNHVKKNALFIYVYKGKIYRLERVFSFFKCPPTSWIFGSVLPCIWYSYKYFIRYWFSSDGFLVSTVNFLGLFWKLSTLSYFYIPISKFLYDNYSICLILVIYPLSIQKGISWLVYFILQRIHKCMTCILHRDR